ncbi:MAG TPA: 30S ribosomal protein S4 [Acidobacteriota bacterium]|nr:30S ribosomal protein S4 [Acidobacteriota bacterium]
MARYREAKCRLCRREGMKLFLKGDRCFKDTCAVEKRNWPPGQHGRDHRPKTVGYGVQLREKQKVKRIYRVLENQFSNYFAKAEKKKGITGETLLLSLERRLDNVVCRLGFAASRDQARQLVTHGHVLVNGKKVDIASAQVNAGDVITLREKTRKIQQIQDSVAGVGGRGGVPAWLELDAENLKGTVVSLPKRDDVQMPIDEQLIVELYSK